MSHPPGPGGQPYVPTEAEQAEHLRNLASRLEEFWVEQLQEVSLLEEDGGRGCWGEG